MNELESRPELFDEGNKNFPTIDYGRMDGTKEKAENLGMIYENGILKFSNSKEINQIDASKASDILIREAEGQLIIEITFSKNGKEAYAEYMVDNHGQVIQIEN